MILQPQKPIREFRFQLTLRFNNGEEKSVILNPDQDAAMDLLVQSLEQFVGAEFPVANIIIDVGDRTDRYIPEGEEPLPGIQTRADLEVE